MKRYKAIPLFLMSLSAPVFAQQAVTDTTLTRTVVVENEYNPDILDASKVNIMPRVEEPSVAKKDIEYSDRLMPATSFGPYRQLMPLTHKETQPDAQRGYARLGYGNNNNVDAKLTYLWDMTAQDRLAILASLDGWNGKLHSGIPEVNPDKWKSRFYRTTIGLDYQHRFNKVTMGIGANYQSDVFNYQPQSPGSDDSDKQHHSKADFSTRFASPNDALPLEFDAEAGYRYFDKAYLSLQNFEPDVEQHIYARADVKGALTDEQKVGLKAGVDRMLYSAAESGPRNYTAVNLTPYYTYCSDAVRARLGVQVSFASHVGKKMMVAPDITLEYSFADAYTVYLNAGGGRELNDFRQLEAANPYWEITRAQDWRSTNVLLNAKLGLKAAPMDGLRFEVFGGYQIRDNDLCFDGGHSYGPGRYIKPFMDFADTKALQAGVNAQYSYKDILSLAAKAVYYNWDVEADKEYMLLMKPEFDFDIHMDIKALPGLYFNIDYNYVIRSETEDAHATFRLDPINNLSLGATYKFTRCFSAYAKLNNLLNQEYQYYVLYPAPKLNFLAGISLRF